MLTVALVLLATLNSQPGAAAPDVGHAASLPQATILKAQPDAITLPVTTTYTQTFDSLGTSATATMPTDWRVDKRSAAREVGTYAGSVNVTERLGGDALSTTAGNGIYNFGAGPAATATDRAVGFLSSGTGTVSGNVYAQFVNNSGGNINRMRISYDVEKYRNGSNAAGYRIQMYYSFDGSSWITATDFLTNFPADANNNGCTPAPCATVAVSNQVLTPTTPLANGGLFYLAWNYSVNSGTSGANGQALGIDNFSIYASPVDWNSTVSAGAALAAPGIFFNGGETQVFVGGNGGIKQAFRGSDGSQLWAQNLHGAVQQRGPIVPIDSISNTVGITNVVLVTSQDGYVDALSAANGAAFWSTPLGSVVAGPAFQPNVVGAPGCSTPCNLVFTGTYTDTSPAANIFVALDAENGNIVWTFPNGGPPVDGVIPQALGLVTTAPSVDYATNTVYFGTASVTGGGGGGLWALDTRTGLLRPGYPNIAIGNVVNSAPTLSRDGLTLYIGTVSQPGSVVVFHAINAPTGADRASFTVPAGVGDFRGAPWAWPNGGATDIYSTAGDRVYAFTDTGAPGGLTLKPGFGGVNGYAIVPGGGTPLYRFDIGFLYVGGNDGALYKINATDGTQASSLFLGAVAAVSDPTYDRVLNRFYVTHNGSLYSIGGNF
jgi:hypothetical protein